MFSHSSNPSFDLSCLSRSAVIFLKVISLRALPKGDGWSESNRADSDCDSEADCVAKAAKDCVDSRYLQEFNKHNPGIQGRSNLTVCRKDRQSRESELEWNVIPECLFIGAIRFLESIQSVFFESDFNPMQYIKNVVLFWSRIQHQLRAGRRV